MIMEWVLSLRCFIGNSSVYEKRFLTFSSLSISSAVKRDSKIRPISNEVTIEFLNQILSDTTDLQILHSKSELISNFSSGDRPPLIALNNYLSKSTSIYKSLNESDTLFLRQ
jgi:hypothetical protein